MLEFDYTLDYDNINFREQPELTEWSSEQGVLQQLNHINQKLQALEIP